jgi:hypothetical protein
MIWQVSGVSQDVNRHVWRDDDCLVQLSADLRPIGFPKFNHAYDLPSLLPCSVNAVFRSSKYGLCRRLLHVTGDSMSSDTDKGVGRRLRLIGGRASPSSTIHVHAPPPGVTFQKS